MALIFAIVEWLIMLLFNYILPELAVSIETVLDAALLVLISIPMI